MIDLREKIKAHARTLEALENTEEPSNNGYTIETVAIGKNGDLIALGSGIMTYAVGVGLKTYVDDRGKTGERLSSSGITETTTSDTMKLWRTLCPTSTAPRD